MPHLSSKPAAKNLPYDKISSHSEISPKEQLVPQGSSAGKASLSQNTVFPSSGLGIVITSATPKGTWIRVWISGRCVNVWFTGTRIWNTPQHSVCQIWWDVVTDQFWSWRNRSGVQSACCSFRGWGSLSRTHMGTFNNHMQFQIQGSDTLFWTPQAKPSMHAYKHTKGGRIETIE